MVALVHYDHMDKVITFNSIKDNLSLDDINQIADLLSRRLGPTTRNNIKQNLMARSRYIAYHELFDRLVKVNRTWKYSPKQSFLEETVVLRRLILKS